MSPGADKVGYLAPAMLPTSDIGLMDALHFDYGRGYSVLTTCPFSYLSSKVVGYEPHDYLAFYAAIL